MNSDPVFSVLIDFFFPQGRPLFKPGARLLIACSGGPDSVGLVRALYDMRQVFPYQFMLGHVNHQLRGRESNLDEKFVEVLASEVGWRFRSIHRPVRSVRGNLEEKAREQRYAALAKMAKQWRCAAVLTAHTMDDQAETLLMNVMRGTGPDGLAGIWPIRTNKELGIKIGRPVLQLSKQNLVNYLNSFSYSFRTDRSNRNPTFLRNWLRKEIIPKLESRAPGFKKRCAQLADVLREEQIHWAGEVEKVKDVVLRKYRGGALLDFKKLLSYSAAAQRRLLRHVVGGDILSFEAVEKLRHWMNQSPTNGRVWQLRKGWVAERLSKSGGAPSASLFWLRKSRKSERRSQSRGES